jgi:hypothetical protein
MSISDGAYLTQSGEALIAKILAQKGGLRFMGVGVGNGDIQEGHSPYNAIEPNGYLMDAEIEYVTNPVNGTAQVGIQISSIGVEYGFYITNLVLYAEDPESGKVAYAYFAQHEHPQWIRPEGEAVNSFARFELAIIVSGVQLLRADINPNVFITRDQMEIYFETEVRPLCLADAIKYVEKEHNKDPNPLAHPDIRRGVRSNTNRLEEIEKILNGQGSSSFFYDFVDILDVDLQKGVWNEELNRLEF